MIRLQPLHGDPYVDAWTAIAMVLAQVQDQAAPRDLPIQRRVVVESVVPVDFEAEVFEVEFICFGDVEDAEDWGDGLEFDCHVEFFYLNFSREVRLPRGGRYGICETIVGSGTDITSSGVYEMILKEF